ncbi:MlaD family protein [Nocardia vaccinii]|uniref:MlaD family protein n=1 Tax=Nocardia vaccinii TaxID=1822 RepID=UPI0008377077|nr:MlaD family protein [Nocardia vaccinii]
MTRIPAWLSGLALVGVLLLGGGYLAFDVLAIEPVARERHVTVDMSDTGGLRTGSDVVYRGVNIGRITDVRSIAGGVRLALAYDADYRIPVASEMRVESLSAMGEPVFAFLPRSTAGPWLTDHARLTGTVRIPTSVPQLLASASDLLGQVDPQQAARVVDTFARAVTGLDTTLPAIGRGADLLLTTLLAHQDSMQLGLRNLMRIMHDTDWIEPALTSAPPQIDQFGKTLGTSYEYLFQGSQQLRGKEILGAWHVQENELVDYLQRLAPQLGAIGVALRPVTRAAGPLLGSVDLADLLQQALTALPGDRVRIALVAPGH